MIYILKFLLFFNKMYHKIFPGGIVTKKVPLNVTLLIGKKT